MNDFSYYVIGKEKIMSLQEEGIRNQAVHSAGSSKPNLRGLPKLMLGLLGILSILGPLIR